jgi:hypothetical protein
MNSRRRTIRVILLALAASNGWFPYQTLAPHRLMLLPNAGIVPLLMVFVLFTRGPD